MVTNAGDDSEPVYPVNVQYGGHFKHKMAQPVSWSGLEPSVMSGCRSDWSITQKFPGGTIKFQEISRISRVVDTLQLPSYIYHRTTYLSLPPYLSYYNWTLPLFFLYSSSNLLLPTLISILLSYHVHFPHSLPSRSSHLHTVVPQANLLVALW